MENIQNLEERPLWKKILIGILSLFLLSLFLSYFLLSYPLFQIFESIFESKISKENKIIFEEVTIIFQNNTYNLLQQNYYEDQSVEFTVCLKGQIVQENYIIQSLYTPKIYEQSFNHVRFEACSNDTLVLLHSHPFRRCIASKQDLITLESVKQRNNNTLMVIMCEPNRFSLY
ncbi:hypothetical protein K8R33_02540 [archaeon]|nr:hypothetical protein [archaeon]